MSPSKLLGAVCFLAIAGVGGIGSAAAQIDEPGDECFAVVRADGTFVRGFRAIGSSRSPSEPGKPGTYQVLFELPITRCAFLATLGHPGAQNPPQIGRAHV